MKPTKESKRTTKAYVPNILKMLTGEISLADCIANSQTTLKGEVER